jgi:hypothetical protein
MDGRFDAMQTHFDG